jgi:3',5'-cyclic AMP phosphodiesterase CpdA
MIVAQLTDIHIKPEGRLAYRQVDSAACIRAAVAQVNAAAPAPDLILVTGDLVDAGLPEEYALLRGFLAPLRAPVFLMPGNHDARGPLRAAFPDHAYLGAGEGPICYAIEAFPLRIVALDSVVPGEAFGTIGAEQLAWLDRTLAAAPDRETLLAVHHPPFATGIGHMDAIGLRDADALAAIVSRHRQVRRIVSGHVHRAVQTLWAGTLASIAPSVAHQVALDLRADAEPMFYLEPAGFQLHRYTPETGIVSHTAAIGDWQGPFPFFDADGTLID